MLNKSLIGVFFITFIYLLAIFLKQPLEYVFNLPLLPLSLLSLILGIFFFNIFSISSNIVEGREFIKKNILQLAIVLSPKIIKIGSMLNGIENMMKEKI